VCIQCLEDVFRPFLKSLNIEEVSQEVSNCCESCSRTVPVWHAFAIATVCFLQFLFFENVTRQETVDSIFFFLMSFQLYSGIDRDGVATWSHSHIRLFLYLPDILNEVFIHCT
jgi:hypothetical protein